MFDFLVHDITGHLVIESYLHMFASVTISLARYILSIAYYSLIRNYLIIGNLNRIITFRYNVSITIGNTVCFKTVHVH